MAVFFLVLAVRGASAAGLRRPADSGATQLSTPLQPHGEPGRQEGSTWRARNQSDAGHNSADPLRAGMRRRMEPAAGSRELGASADHREAAMHRRNRLVAMLLDRGPQKTWLGIGMRVIDAGRRVSRTRPRSLPSHGPIPLGPPHSRLGACSCLENCASRVLQMAGACVGLWQAMNSSRCPPRPSRAPAPTHRPSPCPRIQMVARHTLLPAG